MRAGSAPVTGLQKTFALDSGILGSASAASLKLGGATDADVIAAVATDQPFPTRPKGIIDLAHIPLTASGENPVEFQGNGVTIGFQFSAGVTAGADIFDNAPDALSALALGEAPGLDLTIGAAANSRYALLRAGYQASGSVSGSHPIGLIGSVTFGASAAAAGLSAVLHRFASNAGADTVLKQTVESWKLPQSVNSVGSLAPATWILAEASGSFAVNVATSLGYNFNFVRQFGDTLLESLLLFEPLIIEKAHEALKDVQGFLSSAGKFPSQAVDRLAHFAADITTAFNQLIGNSVFTDLASFRSVAQVIFAEASRALNGGLGFQPRAMLTLDTLNTAPPRKFHASSFLDGQLPASADIAVAQRLITALR